MSRPTGPIEEYPWPEELRGHVVTPGADPRIHGYSVERDLALHYRFSDVSLLALIGELPSDEQMEAFDAAMTFLAPLALSEGPTHAAALAQICGARTSGVLGVSAVALAERARLLVQESAPMLEWLASSRQSPDPRLTTADHADTHAVDRLREVLAARGVHIEYLTPRLSRQEALIATLWFAGLTRPEQIEAALVLASLAGVFAEAQQHVVASFRDYPMQLPPFEYEDP